MSWSMLEPEEPPICESKYEEARDVMDRDDCSFHCDLPPDTPEVIVQPVKPQASARKFRQARRVRCMKLLTNRRVPTQSVILACCPKPRGSLPVVFGRRGAS
jgi:hypothetical protein